MLQIGNRPSAAFPSIFLSFQYLIEPHSRHAKLEGLPVLGHFPHLEDRERVANIAQPSTRRSRVHTAWDLSVSDSTAIWFIQFVDRERRLQVPVNFRLIFYCAFANLWCWWEVAGAVISLGGFLACVYSMAREVGSKGTPGRTSKNSFWLDTSTSAITTRLQTGFSEPLSVGDALSTHTLTIVTRAFHRACILPAQFRDGDYMRRRLAVHIITHVNDGESDPARVADSAVSSIPWY
jgi:hypothetical protein